MWHDRKLGPLLSHSARRTKPGQLLNRSNGPNHDRSLSNRLITHSLGLHHNNSMLNHRRDQLLSQNQKLSLIRVSRMVKSTRTDNQSLTTEKPGIARAFLIYKLCQVKHNLAEQITK
jgi:hypothetical protein